MKVIKILVLLLLILVVLVLFFIDLPKLLVDKNVGSWTIGYKELHQLEDGSNVEKGKFLKDHLKDTIFNFIADPFVYKDTSGIYIFAEHVFNENGDVSVFYSKDTMQTKFTYKGVVLDETFHLSYPQVFTYKKEKYMLPETQGSGNVILYKAVSFPEKWEKYKSLLHFDNVKDPTIYFKDDKIYLFGCQENRLYCWVSNSFEEKFVKMSKPVLIGTESRPGGRIFEYHGKIIMPIQNNSNGYGTGLSLYELDFSNQDKVKAKRYQKFFLFPQNNIAEYSHGMHHMDMIPLNGSYFMVYDGNPKLDNEKRFHYKHFIKYSYLNFLNLIN